MDIPSWKKLYPTLGGVERFRLAALAASRGDDEEIRRLVSTCPRFDVSRLDGGFLAVKHAAATTSQAMATPVSHFLGWLDAIGALDRFVSTGVAEIGFGRDGSSEGIKRLVAAARDRALSELRAMLDAYEDLAREVGLDPGFMLGSLPDSVLAGLAHHGEQIRSKAPDPPLSEGWRMFLLGAWEEALGAEPAFGRSPDPP